MAQPLSLWLYFICTVAFITLYTSLQAETPIITYFMVAGFAILLASKVVYWLCTFFHQETSHRQHHYQFLRERQVNFREGIPSSRRAGYLHHQQAHNLSPYQLIRNSEEVPSKCITDIQLEQCGNRAQQEIRLDRLNKRRDPSWSKSSYEMRHQPPASNEDLFGSIHIWQFDNFDQIKWAEKEFQELNMKLPEAKDLILKLRAFLRKEFQDYDREQTSKYNQMTRLTNILFGFTSVESRNSYLRKIEHILFQYQKTGQILRMSSMKFNENLSKRDFSEKLDQLKTVIESMTFSRFLESNSKADLLQFYKWVLKTKVLVNYKVKIVETKSRIQPSSVINQSEQVIFFVQPENFCYTSIHQSPHCLNLEETILIVILRSSDYQLNPSLLRRIVNS